MTFNSWIFCFFFIVVFVTYHILKHKHQAQNLMLLIASCIFYGAWNWQFLLLILSSTFVDYNLSLAIFKTKAERQRRFYLICSCVYNLGILCFFKYFNFFIKTTNDISNVIGVPFHIKILPIILPLGISFHTFQSLSYVIDVYRKKINPLNNILDFGLYITFFPQLVAGPIERGTHFIPQLINARKITENQYVEGVWLIFFGLFKKIVVADNLGIYADEAFNSFTSISGTKALLGIYAFAFQIYGDFSGYSDIARGLAKLLGFELMLNFNRPYLAINPSDFWQRWHISLSTWLRDYLYIPLGGNRHGELNTYRNLMLTMLLGGLWHGANLTFIFWGVYHGLILILHRWWSKKKQIFSPENHHLKYILMMGMFHITCFGWLIFRADSIQQVAKMSIAILTNFRWDIEAVELIFPLLFFGGGLWVLEHWLDNADDPRTRPGWKNLGALICSCLFLVMIFLGTPERRQFLYFQF